jgi:hypothetical protein
MQGSFHRPVVSAACVLTAAAFFVGIGVAVPAYAEKNQSSQTENGTHADRVEERITDLHTRLGITEAEEESWSKVAAVMRENANAMAGLIQARSGKADSMTAVDDLKSYGQIAEAHADGIQRFTPVFGALYDKMSDEQRTNADLIFRDHSHKALKRMAARGG